MKDALLKGLTITATPIGNLADLAPRARASLEGADIIACEDTRHTGLMLHRLGISHAALVAYHDHSKPIVEDRLIAKMRDGASVVLVSDAGTPLIADPGYRLVRRCVREDLPITTIPGPSAVLSALVLSGFATDCFFFAGFLPNPQAQRHARLAELLALPHTSIIYESPKRLLATLAMVASLAPMREVAVARELTKLHEAVYRGTAEAITTQLTAQFAAISKNGSKNGSTPKPEADPQPKGEMVVLLSPASNAPHADETKITGLLGQALGYGLSVSRAAKLISTATGVRRRYAYDLALKIGDASNASKTTG